MQQFLADQHTAEATLLSVFHYVIKVGKCLAPLVISTKEDVIGYINVNTANLQHKGRKVLKI
jgi:hypothetical protein